MVAGGVVRPHAAGTCRQGLSSPPGRSPKTKRPGKKVCDSVWLPRYRNAPPTLMVWCPRSSVRLSPNSQRRMMVKLGRKMLLPNSPKPLMSRPTPRESLEA